MKKPLFQGKFDKWTPVHFLLFVIGTRLLRLWFEGRIYDQEILILAFLGGLILEVGQWDGYKSESSIDVWDLMANLAGSVVGFWIP